MILAIRFTQSLFPRTIDTRMNKLEKLLELVSTQFQEQLDQNKTIVTANGQLGSNLVSATDQIRNELSQTRNEVSQTRNDVNQTRNVLDQTRNVVDQTRSEVTQTRSAVDKTKTDLDQTIRVCVDQLRNEARE